MSVRGQIHHLDRPAPYTAIACTKENAILALTDLSIEAPVVVDIASTTNFVGPVPTLTKYPVLPGETFNLFTYVQRFVGADELVIGNLHHLKQANSWRTFLDATKDVPVLTSKYAELLDEGYIS
ncbi:hypothetical protein QR680_010449 [Steinernema hermaphroditum]|uniref:Uncharacterized protein n=1 Tax=Steinernema hermaphroditum TaxID=289476 RepID=A0AA39IRP7_9BILA|nr:hypothetical protein QR680_010449 [Steinernema hermaphroditum]